MASFRIKILLVPAFLLFLILLVFPGARLLASEKKSPAPVDNHLYLLKNVTSLNKTGHRSFETYNRFYLSEAKGNSFTASYLKSLTRHMLDRSIHFEKISNTAMSQEDGYSEELRKTEAEIENEKRASLFNAAWYAGIEVTRNSRFYKAFEYYEQQIAKYCYFEYSKNSNRSNPDLYLPGTVTESARKEKKDYRFTLSAFAAPDEETAKIDMNLNCTTLVSKINSRLSYSVVDDRTTLTTAHKGLDEFIHAELRFIVREVFQQEKVYMTTLALHF